MSPTVFEDRNREAEMWDAYQRNRNDGAALEKLIEYYLPMVVEEARWAAARAGRGLDVREFLGAGVMGLHEAAQRFDRERRVTFRTFARARVRGAMVEELRNRDHLTRRQRAKVRKLRELVDTLSAQFGRAPTTEEIARRADMRADDVSSFLQLGVETASLEEENEQGLRHIDRLADDGRHSPRDEVDFAMTRDLLRESIKQLDPRDQQLLYFRHEQGLSVQEIAEAFGVSAGRISQMHSAAIQKLRVLMHVEHPATACALS
jgi:RNA polymerase sigma factor for flagellar operon FliA